MSWPATICVKTFRRPSHGVQALRNGHLPRYALSGLNIALTLHACMEVFRTVKHKLTVDLASGFGGLSTVNANSETSGKASKRSSREVKETKGLMTCEGTMSRDNLHFASKQRFPSSQRALQALGHLRWHVCEVVITAGLCMLEFANDIHSCMRICECFIGFL